MVTENRNFIFDKEKDIFYFKKCPRSFLKTDMPAKRPNKWCPFRAHYWPEPGQNEFTGRCLLPSGLRYAEEKGINVWTTDRVCYKCLPEEYK